MSKEQAFSADRVSPHPFEQVTAGAERARWTEASDFSSISPQRLTAVTQPSEKSEKTREKRRKKTA